MRNIERYIEDLAADDEPVHLEVILMSDGQWRARLLSEANTELLDRKGEHYMIAWGDAMEDVLTELNELAGA